MSNEERPPREKILIAEDSPPNRKILQHLLEKLGFDVIACDNGKRAWDALQSPVSKDVLLIISDIMMPDMDGIELLKKIRESEKFKDLPVVLITAVSEKDYIVRAKSLNVSGYILKPVTFQRVQAKLKELFPEKVFPSLAG